MLQIQKGEEKTRLASDKLNDERKVYIQRRVECCQ